MAIKGLKSTQLANDPTTSALKFNFKTYEQKNSPFHNNSTDIDFVTYDGSMYVCVEDGVSFRSGNPADNGFLLLVQKGADGRQGIDGKEGPMGPMPNYALSFDGKQLVVVEQPSGIRKAVSPDLTGPVWVPELHDKKIVWVKEESSANTRPADIDLEALRPTEERPILLRTNSDNTKRSDESSGPANMIQWKHEGDEEWTNLISISELMNLTLAGVSFWQDPDDDDSWHFGHKEVVKATYSSDKNATKIVAVELGDVLFDAGKVPFPDNSLDLQAIQLTINELQTELNTIKLQLDGFAKKSDIPTVPTKVSAFENDVPYMSKASADATYQPIGNYAKRVNGYSPDANGEITIPLKTINSESIIGSGNISVSAGGTSLFDVKIENGHLYKTINGTTWIDLGAINTGSGGSGMDDTAVKHLLGQVLEGVLDSAIPEYIKDADHNYFIRMSDLAGYATKAYVDSAIQDVVTGQTDLDYYRIFTLYQRTNSRTVAPNAPVQGNFVWDTSKGEIVLQPTFTSNWENHPQNATDEAPYLWQASATYSYKSKSEVKGDDETEYWHVICLTGEPGKDGANGYNGTDGADGNGVEFIYKLVDSLEEYNSLETPVAPAGEGDDDIPEGWLDHPEGISEEHPIEVASMRSYDGLNKSWGPYCAPFIWSMWGEDGIDGDGVEYIFFVAAEDLVIADEGTGKFSLDPTRYLQSNSPNFIPTTQDQVDALGESYQVSDWISNVDNNWTDNPSDIDAQQPFEFVAIRKYTDENGWGPFSRPKLWGHFGGITITPTYKPYTCYAFHRDGSNDLTNYSVVYDFSSFGANSYSELTDDQKNQFYKAPQNYTKTLDENNNVVSVVWEDTVPSGSEQLWLITAHIGDEDQSSDTGWTSPVRWGDRAGLQVEYSNDSRAENVYLYPSLLNNHRLTLNDFEGTIDERIAAWRRAVLVAYGVWDDNIKDPIYMATSVLDNGVWSNWTVAKIKGEKGDKGDTGPQGENGSPGADGTDIEFVYYRTDSESHSPGMHPTEGSYDGTTQTSEDPYLDDFLPKATASGFTLSDGTYWHDHPSGVNETLTCEWIGIRHSSYQNGQKIWGSFNIALWSKYGEKGRDGDGVEYIFYRTTEYPHTFNGNSNPYNWYQESGDYQNSEYILENSGWTDDPTGVDSEHPYEWVSQRKYNGASGRYERYSAPALWATYTENSESRVITTLDLNNSEKPVQVTEDNLVVVGTDPIYLNTGLFCELKTDSGLLLDWGELYVGYMNNGVATFDSNPNVTFSNYTGSIVVPTTTDSGITRTVVEAFADQNRHYSFRIGVVFPENYVLSSLYVVPIKVVSAIGSYVGIDYLKFNPTNSEKLVEINPLSSGLTRVIKKESIDALEYTPSNIDILPFSEDTSFNTMSKIRYSYSIDDNDEVVFEDVSNLIQSNKESILSDARNGVRYYFNSNGTRITSANPEEYFAELHFWNTDDNQHEWDEWLSVMNLKIDGTLITDKIIVGVGYGSDVSPIMDRETAYVIYPGKNGEQGIQGPVGPQGPQGEPGVTTTVHEYQYLDYPVMRVSNWSGSQLKYYAGGTRVDENNNAVTGNEGTLFLDVIEYNYTNSENESATAYYKCISDVTYTSKVSKNPSSDTTHWEMFSIADNGAFRDLIVTNTAYIKSLGSDQVIILNSNNEIVAGLTGSTETVGSSPVRLWAGQPTTSGNLATTPFNVTDAGKLTASDANITGGSIGGFTINESTLVASTEEADFNTEKLPYIRFGIGDSSMDTNQTLELGMYEDTVAEEIKTKIEQTRGWKNGDHDSEQSVTITPESGIVLSYTTTDNMQPENNASYSVTFNPYWGISFQKNGGSVQTISWEDLFTKLNSIS